MIEKKNEYEAHIKKIHLVFKLPKDVYLKRVIQSDIKGVFG